jgi:hypothetical protein
MSTDLSTDQSADHVVRVLVVSDHAATSPELLTAVRERSERGAAQFRVVVPNPAAAELHLLHPERHVKAAEAEGVLRRALPMLEAAAGSHVIGSVSVRHDPMDAVEETLFSEPVDEIMIAVHSSHLATALHQDLPHRLRHLGLPLTIVVPSVEHSRIG